MTTIKLRRGASSSFSTNNPTLAAGEPAFETDTGKLKIGDGTTAYNSLTYVGDGFGLKNNATGTNSLAIFGTATAQEQIAIGNNTSISSGNSTIAIGHDISSTGSGNIIMGYSNTVNKQNVVILSNSVTNAKAGDYCIMIGTSNATTSNNAIAIGNTAGANGSYAIGLGYQAKANANYAIQLGKGTNTTANTFSVGLSSSDNYMLLDSSGIVPNSRLNLDTTVTSGSSNAVTSGAVYTAIDNAVNGVTSSLNNLNSGTGTV